MHFSGVDNFLTKEQRKDFFGLDDEFQATLESLLESSNQKWISRAQLVLDIIESLRIRKIQADYRQIFIKLLDHNNEREINSTLEKILLVVEKGHGESFFKFSSTQKRELHSASTLIRIVNLFWQLIEVVPPTFSLSSLAPFDRGGEEYVLHIIQNPKEKEKEENKIPLQQLAGSSFLDDHTNFATIRLSAIRYLTSLSEKNRLPMKIYLKIFHKIQNDAALTFKECEKMDLLKLILWTTTHPSSPLAQTYALADLEELLEEAQKVHQKCGEEVLLLFHSAGCLRNNNSLEDVVQALRWIYSLDLAAQGSLEKFSTGKIPLAQLLEEFENCNAGKEFDPRQSERNLDQLRKRFSEKNQLVSFPLESAILEKILKQYEEVKIYCDKWKTCKMSQITALAIEIRELAKKAPLDESHILQLVALGRLATRLKFGIYPYDTQILVLLGLLTGTKGKVAQVKTGEGKSTIVCLLSFMLAMQAQPVDNISSSSYLAGRDCRKYANFFKAFGIKISHICDSQKQRPEHFGAHIFYTTATDLEFAIMREKLYFARLFEERIKATDLKETAGCVIVDELDNLTIDTLMNGARLSVPAEISYDWVYGPILSFIRSMKTKEAEYYLLISALLESGQSKGKIHSEFLNLVLRLLVQTNSVQNLREYLSTYMEGRFKEEVMLLSDGQLQRWLMSAHKALFELKENEDYVIEEKTKKQVAQRKVVIMDADNTGEKMEGMHWSHGLSEFVDTIHHIPVRRESLNPLSMSHAVFYSRYSSIYGLTGTLGSSLEREELKEIYGSIRLMFLLIFLPNVTMKNLSFSQPLPSS